MCAEILEDYLILQIYTHRHVKNDEKIAHFLDVTEVFLVWSIVLSTLHLNFVKKRQMSRAAKELDRLCSKIPHRSKILQKIKNMGWVCDVITFLFLLSEIVIYINFFPIVTLTIILGSFFATVVSVGIFHEICIKALKTRLILKHMNSLIQVKAFF